MKKATFATIIIASAFFANAQSIPVPDFQYKIMGVAADNTLFSLDKTAMSVQDNAHSMFSAVNSARMLSGKTKVYYSADGSTSNVKLSGKTTDRFIISIPPSIDPEDGII